MLVRRADDQLARRGLKTTTVDIAWAGGRIEAIAVREWPVPRTPRMWAEWALRTVSAPLVLHGMMSPGLRDAVVQQAIEIIDNDTVTVAVDLLDHHLGATIFALGWTQLASSLEPEICPRRGGRCRRCPP